MAQNFRAVTKGATVQAHLCEQLAKLNAKHQIKRAAIMCFILSCCSDGESASAKSVAATLAGSDAVEFKFRTHPFFARLKGAPVYELLDIVGKLISNAHLHRSGVSTSLSVLPAGLKQLQAWGVDTLGLSAYVPDAAQVQTARQRALAASDQQALEGLCTEQLQVMEAVLNQGKSVFFTGAAGTGKTYTLRRLISLLKSKGHQVAVTASTGVAACALGGSTIHSWSGMGRATEGVEALAARTSSSRSTRQRWQNAQVLVLDEVSMIDGEFLDKLDVVARRCRGCNRLPFGGMQMVFVGDFCQLPPVAPRGGASVRFAFQSAAWRGAVQASIVLKQVYRQATDLPFIHVLSKLRFGQVDSDSMTKLQSAQKTTVHSGGSSCGELTRLSARNASVDALNERKLKLLPGTGCTYVAKARLPSNPHALPRSQKLLAQLQAGCPARSELQLRVGSAVMLLHNLDVSAGLTNGTRGTVVGFDFKKHHSAEYRRQVTGDHSTVAGSDASSAPQTPAAATAAAGTAGSDSTEDASQRTGKRSVPLPIVQFTTVIGGRTRELEPFPVQVHDFEVQEDAQHWAALRQIPLALAWAVTIHKSQGMTLHNVHIDCSGIFETGQTYVALSRASALSGLALKGFNQEHVRANPVALAFHTSIGDGPHVASAATPSPAHPPRAPPPAASAQGGAAADSTARALAFSPIANRTAPVAGKRPRSPATATATSSAHAAPGSAKRSRGAAGGGADGPVSSAPGKAEASSRLRALLRARKGAKAAATSRPGW